MRFNITLSEFPINTFVENTMGFTCHATVARPQERPIESLPSTDPLPFELRVAVFKAVQLGGKRGDLLVV